MGRIGRTPWGILRALLASLVLGGALAGALSARTSEDGGPRIAYGSYAPDERLTLNGLLVRPEVEARMEQLRRAESARIASVQTYPIAPAIWRIKDADSTIYIFGTVHSLPPGFRWRNAELEGVIVRADTLLLESTAEEGAVVTFQEGISKVSNGAMPTLIERASPRYRDRLRQLQAMLPPESVKSMDAMPTWIAAMGIGYLRNLLVGDIPGPGADDWLEQHFRATGRRVEAIENAQAVVANINAIPESAQRMMLDAALAAPDSTHEQLDAPAHAWARGDVSDTSPLRIYAADLDPGQRMADPLLTQRNQAWVVTLIQRLKDRPGTTLFAAGAGHFVGPGSVIDLLQRRGVTVERVQ